MFEALIQQAAARHNLDPALLSRLVGAESGGNPNAVSPKGALGLGQLMPGTAKMMGVSDPRDPSQNINGAAGYLSQLARSHGGDMRQALAAYNWGPGNLARAGGDVSRAPAETQSYLQKLLGTDARTGLPEPPPPPPGPPAMAQVTAQVAPPAAQAALQSAVPQVSPAVQAMPETQQTNQDLLMQRAARGELADSGTLSSLLLGLPGAGAVGMPRRPQAPAASPFARMGVA